MLASHDALPNGRATAPKTGQAGKPVILLFLEVFKSCIIKSNELTNPLILKHRRKDRLESLSYWQRETRRI